jgi:hypothetical protein
MLTALRRVMSRNERVGRLRPAGRAGPEVEAKDSEGRTDQHGGEHRNEDGDDGADGADGVLVPVA